MLTIKIRAARHVAHAAIALSVAALAACNDSNTLGSSLVEDQVEVLEYEAPAPTGISVSNPSIQSRSIVQLLGRLNAKGYGRLHSEIVTQFYPALSLPDSITAERLDSVMLGMEMYSSQLTGDSIVPMGFEVHRLTRQLPSPIFSDFDPAGYYDPAVYASAIYSPANIGLDNDSALNSATRTILCKLPKQLGLDIIEKYATDPSVISNPQAFTSWFPGFYITNSFGSGRVVRISRTSVRLHCGSYTFMVMAVTPEVVNNSDMSLAVSSELKARVDAGETLIVAPVGYDVEMTFPAKQLLEQYRSTTGALAVVNSLTMSIPAEEVTNDYGITPPTTLLLVRTSKKDEFFSKNQIPDNVYSFYASYNSTSKTYEFTGMKAYLDSILTQESLAEENYRFTLTPVNVNTETNSYGTSTYVTGVAPYVGEPKMVKLDLSGTTITLNYSRQSLNN